MSDWIVSVHMCGGSTGEAVQSMITLGPYSEDVAKAVEREFHERIKDRNEFGELWALAEPLDRIHGNVKDIVDGLVKNDGIVYYIEEEDGK